MESVFIEKKNRKKRIFEDLSNVMIKAIEFETDSKRMVVKME